MPNNFTDIEVSGLARAGLFFGPLSAAGITPVAANSNPSALPAGPTHNVVLPDFGPPGSPMIWILTSSADAVIDGLASVGVAEVGQMILLINGNPLSGDTIATAAATGSTAGNQFSVAFELAAGTGVWLIYLSIGGVKYWVPMWPIAVPS